MPSSPPSKNKNADVVFTPRDQGICEGILRTAARQNDKDKPLSWLLVSTALRFVGAPYQAQTLEQGVTEPLVANLCAFDCSTFIETVAATVLAIKSRKENFADFISILERIRYRKGLRDCYASRLHYFTEWIWDNQRKGFLVDLTPQIGGVPVKKGIHGITNHRNEHKQLQDENVFRKMRNAETICSRRIFHVIPKESWRPVEEKIENGDIIAIATNRESIDVIHVGFAVLKKKRVYLLHASSNAKAVVLSEITVHRYLQQRSYRTGVIVARLKENNSENASQKLLQKTVGKKIKKAD
jgi:hypothetical protein